MNQAATSKDKILDASNRIVAQQGITAVNMRTVATECGVAVGCIYNYFPSKSDLMNATIEKIWLDIFHMNKGDMQFDRFIDALAWLFQRIQQGSLKYPDFFSMHALNLSTKKHTTGKIMMDRYLHHVNIELVHILLIDKNVREDVFNEALTPKHFVDYVMSLLISKLLRKDEEYASLLKLIENCIY